DVTNTSDTRARTLLRETRAIGADVPAAILDAERAEQDALQRVKETEETAKTLPNAIAAALAAGKDPAADKTVAAALAAHQLTQAPAWRTAQEHLRQPVTAARQEHADATVAARRVPFGEHAAVLARCAKHLGDVDLSDAEAILSAGGDAAQHRLDALTAEKGIGRMTHALTRILSGQGVRVEYHALLLTPNGYADRFPDRPSKPSPGYPANCGQNL